MEKTSLLEGKIILIVDDEPDVVSTLKDILTMCRVVGASTFHEARELLETQYFDMAILDIMGVQGFELLEIANTYGVIPVMLTAHAQTLENIQRSYNEGAANYVPKEAMQNIVTYLNDILEAKEKGRNFWWRWFDRFAHTYCEKKFGPDWQKKDKGFWEKFKTDVGN